VALLVGRASAAETIRIATLNAGLVRAGPGLLLRDILSGKDAQVASMVALVAQVRPDVLLLTAVDHDFRLVTLRALAARLKAAGAPYPHLFAPPPNTGLPTGLDVDGDGRLGGPRDAQGYGAFAGQGGMALLSRFPIRARAARDFSHMLWADLPGADLPAGPKGWAAVQRLSSVAHWDVPVVLPDGTTLHLLAWHATTPAFDGPENRNDRRNRDENRFWRLYLDGKLPWPAPKGPLVLLGDANLDPNDGEGDRAAVTALLSHPRLIDPQPAATSGGPVGQDVGVNKSQRGNPALDTADWRDSGGPGNLRVDYVLPSRDLAVQGAGVVWSAASGANGTRAVRHGLVWVDVRR